MNFGMNLCTETDGNVQASNVAGNSLDISFQMFAEAIGYLISVISEDATDVRLIEATGSPFTLTGLNANTNYQVGVDAVVNGARTEIGALSQTTTEARKMSKT